MVQGLDSGVQQIERAAAKSSCLLEPGSMCMEAECPFPAGLENNLAELKRITNLKFEKWNILVIFITCRLSSGELLVSASRVLHSASWRVVGATRNCAVYLSWRLGYTSPQVATRPSGWKVPEARVASVQAN